MTRSGGWSLVEKVERQRGVFEQSISLLQQTLSSPDGDRFWAPVDPGAVLDDSDKLSAQDFYQTALNKGLWYIAFQPRQLYWAWSYALRLHEHSSPMLADIPVSASSLPVFNAAAIRNDTATCVLVNFPLLLGLEICNAKYFSVLDAVITGWEPYLPAFLWKRLSRTVMRPVWRDYQHAIRWILNPQTYSHQFIPWRKREIQTDHNCVAGHNVVYLQALFIVLHEFGHICSGHLDQGPMLDKHSAPVLIPSSPDLELQADEFAVRSLGSLVKGFSINGIGVKGESAVEMVLVALVFLFMTFASIEGWQLNLGISLEYKTHPPALLRWAHIMALLKKDPSFAPRVDEYARSLALFSKML